MFTTEEITEIVRSQLDSLLWTEGEIYDEKGDVTLEMWDEIYSADDATPELVAQLTEELSTDLVGVELWALEIYREHFGSAWPGQFGHDLALTRNGHGAGFWDRGLGESGDVLTAWADSLGTLHIFHGHDSIHPAWAGMFHAE
jgi:hypothetical protein